MFVKSRMAKDVTYRRKGTDWIIKAGTITYIDENKVTAKELKEFYGSRIYIISRESLDNIENNIPVKKEVKLVENKKKDNFETSKKTTNNVIDTIIKEIKEEMPIKEKEIQVEIIDPIKEAFVTGIGSELVPQKQEENKLKVTKDEIGDLVLDPIEPQVIEIKEEIKIPEIQNMAETGEVKIPEIQNMAETGEGISLLKEGKEEPGHAGADLKIGLDVVQPAQVKKEINKGLTKVSKNKKGSKRGRKSKKVLN